ncbi:MAG: hypothetical protein U9Q67_00620 [Patescibacteria group bacterium]|nr:hypothetical protein [Patescibacteria group bacterium]
MKTLLKIICGLIATLLSIIYMILMPVTISLVPVSRLIISADNVNSLLDDLELEKIMLSAIVSEMMNPSTPETPNAPGNDGLIDQPGTEMPDSNPEQELMTKIVIEMLANQLNDDETISAITQERRTIINKVYTAIIDGVPMSYEISPDLFEQLFTMPEPGDESFKETFVPLFEKVGREEFANLPICADPTVEHQSVLDSFSTGCRPAGTEFEMPDDSQIDEMMGQMQMEPPPPEEGPDPGTADLDGPKEGMEPMVIEINSELAESLHKIYLYVNYGSIVLPVLILILLSLIVLFSPSKVTALIILGINNLVTGIIMTILWIYPKIWSLDTIPILSSNQQTTDLLAQSSVDLPSIIETIMGHLSATGLLLSISTGIIGLGLIVLAVIIFLMKKKNVQTSNT